MEELRKLEQVQVVLKVLRSRGMVTDSSDPDCDRFLANFVLLLAQPCGELDLDRKFILVNEIMPKISRPFLEEVQCMLGQEDLLKPEESTSKCCYQSQLIGGTSTLEFDSGTACRIQTDSSDSETAIGLDAMQRANSTLEDFCRSYFMFHGMDVNSPSSIFKYLPVLFFVESYIYQLDSLNEHIVHQSTRGNTTSQGFSEEKDCNWRFKSDPFRWLRELLEIHGLLTERVSEELASGEEYWALERKLCSALQSREEISVEDVMRGIHLKSFDYRVLNLLLYQLRGETFLDDASKVDDLHMDFLSISELLVEISDDLFDYEDDVVENSFNVLRMFVRIYGASAAPAMLATEAEEKYERLLKALEPELSLKYQLRCEEATAEGGKSGGHALGTWSIPPIIADEESYRSSILDIN